MKASVKSARGRGERPEASRSIPGQGEGGGKHRWRPEPVSGAKLSDELGIGVKGLSRLGIAGSPRNSFRASLRCFLGTVEPLEEIAYLLVAISTKLRMYQGKSLGVRGWGRSSILARGTTQTPS